MPSKKSAAELRAENQFLRRTNLALAYASVVNTLIRFGTIGFCFYCIYLSVAALAGQQTKADILIKFFASVTISKAVAYVLGAGGIIYGISERKLRQRTVTRFQGRIPSLEGKIDARRSSSKLTSKGETNPDDL